LLAAAGDERPGLDDAALRCTLPEDDPDFREIMLSFIEHLTEKIPAIRHAVAQHDYPELARLAHSLKGSGGTAGFPAFTEPARRLEQAALQRREEEVVAAAEEVLRLAERTVASYADSTRTRGEANINRG